MLKRMKNKKIISYILLLALIWGTYPTVADTGDSLVWHVSLTPDNEVVWRMTDYYYISDAFQIAGDVLEEGDIFSYLIVSNPQTVADDVYDLNGPEFIQLYVYHDKPVDWTSISEPIVTVLYPRLIMPLEYHLANGTVLNFMQTIKHIATFDGSINEVIITPEGDYYSVYYNTTYGQIYVDYNINTGIAKSFYTITEDGDATFELDIFESTIDDYGVIITNNLTWHNSLTLGTHLAWRLLDLTNEDGYIVLGEDEFGNEYGRVYPGDTVSLDLLDALPTDPLVVYGDEGDPGAFLQLNGHREMVPWEYVTSITGSVLSWVVNPLSLNLYNGSTYNMTEFILLRGEMDSDTQVTIYPVDSDFVNVHVEWAKWVWDEGMGMDILDNFTATYMININSGIAQSLVFFDPDNGDTALFAFDIFESTIDSYGTPTSYTLTWHSSLTANVAIAWKLVELHSDEPYIIFGSDEFGNEYGHMKVGDDLIFKLKDNLPTDARAVYGELADPSLFLEIIAGHEPLPFEYMDPVPGFLLSYLVNPLQLEFYNGTILNLQGFITMRASSDSQITSYTLTTNGDYLEYTIDFSVWYEDEYSSYLENYTVTYLINVMTGITQELYVANADDPSMNLRFVLDIWESDIDDYGTEIENTLTWFSGLAPITWLSWQITELNTEDPEMNFELAGHNLTVNEFLRFKFYNPIPTDPVDVYGDHGPDFVSLYINNDMASWEDVEGIAGAIFRLMVVPLGLELYNGTTFDLIGFVQLLDAMMDELTITSMSQTSDSVTFAIHMEFTHWEDDGEYTETADVTYTIILATGISSEIFISVPSGNPAYGPSTMRLVYSVPYSSIDQYGNPNSNFEESVPTVSETTGETDNTVRIPGFTVLISSIGVVTAVFMKKRK